MAQPVVRPCQITTFLPGSNHQVYLTLKVYMVAPVYPPVPVKPVQEDKAAPAVKQESTYAQVVKLGFGAATPRRLSLPTTLDPGVVQAQVAAVNIQSNMVALAKIANEFASSSENGAADLAKIPASTPTTSSVVNGPQPKVVKAANVAQNDSPKSKPVIKPPVPQAPIIDLDEIVPEFQEVTLESSAPLSKILASIRASPPVQTNPDSIDGLIGILGDVMLGQNRHLKNIYVEAKQTKPKTESKSTAVAPNRIVIKRKAGFFGRLFWNESHSKFDMSHLQNLEIGELSLKKNHNRGGKLTVPENCVDPEMFSYLMINKFSVYENRDACVDHISKLARKYWTDEKRVKLSGLTGEQVNIHFATVQKVVDERATRFLLAQEDQELDRRKRIVAFQRWVSKNTPFSRSNEMHLN